MLKLTVFNFFLLIIIAALLFLVKKTVRSERVENLLLLISPIITILFHYSTFIFHAISGGPFIDYLRDTPNLILPIYPCNVVMWSALVIPFLNIKNSRFARFLTDYVFWFGILSTLVGMFANVDFIKNPTLKDYEITKSIVAHATLLFNVLLLPIFKRVKVDFWQNLKNIFLSVIEMYVIGLYCNLVFKVLVSPERAYDVNSMFIIHSPIDGINFLKYPIIAAIGLLFYAALFFVCDLIKNKKGERCFNKALAFIKKK